jgi:hypothetical protein
MREMTDEEAEYLDDLWTRTTPEIDMSRPGYFARKGLVWSDRVCGKGHRERGWGDGAGVVGMAA